MREGYYSVYTRQDCIFCTKALKLLNEKKKEYVVVECEEGSKSLTKVQDRYSWRTVPIIFHIRDGEKFFIGGYDQLQELIGQ